MVKDYPSLQICVGYFLFYVEVYIEEKFIKQKVFKKKLTKFI